MQAQPHGFLNINRHRALLMSTWRFCGRFDTRAVYVVILVRVCYNWHVALGSECQVGGSAGVCELTSSIFYAQCLLLGYVHSPLEKSTLTSI